MSLDVVRLDSLNYFIDIKGPAVERVKVTASSIDYKGENHLVIEEELESAGFINIELIEV